jgi:hypothetical protein
VKRGRWIWEKGKEEEWGDGYIKGKGRGMGRWIYKREREGDGYRRGKEDKWGDGYGKG